MWIGFGEVLQNAERGETEPGVIGMLIGMKLLSERWAVKASEREREREKSEQPAGRAGTWASMGCFLGRKGELCQVFP